MAIQTETPVRVRRQTDEPGFWAIGSMVRRRNSLIPDVEDVLVWYCDPTMYPALVAARQEVLHPLGHDVTCENYASVKSTLLAGWEIHPVQSEVNLQGAER